MRLREFYVSLSGVVLLIVPALLNGCPIYFADSRSYYVGGRMVIDRASAVFGHHLGAATVNPTHAKAVRSVYYSVLSYVLGSHASLWTLIVLQALLAVFIIAVACWLFARRDRLLVVLVGLSAASSLPWTVSMFMPDIFTSIAVLTLACLALGWAEMSLRMRGGLLGLLTASIVMHLTNLPIVVGLAVLALALRRDWSSPRWIGIGGAVSTAVVAMLMVGVVGFGKWSIAPQNPPFLLARSVADGPATLYLREHCPAANLVMCNHLDGLNVQDADEFIWSGVFNLVSPEEQDAIRREAWHIVSIAAIEHPWLQTRSLIANFLQQLSFFDLRDVRFPNSAEVTSTDLTSHIRLTFPGWLVALSAVIYVATALSLVAILAGWSHYDSRTRHFILLITAAVVINAFTGAIANPSARYEARIIWLLTMVALMFGERPVPLHRR